jgi:hypothetical protein
MVLESDEKGSAIGSGLRRKKRKYCPKIINDSECIGRRTTWTGGKGDPIAAPRLPPGVQGSDNQT